MTHSLYILYSTSIDSYYVGESDNAETRLTLHNKHHYKKAFTKAASDWEIVLNFRCDSKENALFLERFIKRMKSKNFILKIINNQAILTDILNRNK